MSSGSVTLPETTGGGSGITSINGDTTANQLIVGGSGISVSTTSGTTTITNTAGGSVTSVSSSGTQGVITSVTNPTTTPNIAIGLGAITPSSVAATGTVTGSNLSGTNTGDQTIASGTNITVNTVGSTSTINNSAPTQSVAAGTGISVMTVGTTTTVTNTSPSSGGTVTSVDVSGGTTGLTTSGGPVTTSGTISLAGTLAVANGGTGATTAPVARVNLNVDERTAVSDADYVVLNTDRYVGLTSITANRTFTLPAASTVNAGQTLIIEDESGLVNAAQSLTITPNGGDNINGVNTSIAITVAYGAVELISNGSNGWFYNITSQNVLAGSQLPNGLVSSTTVVTSATTTFVTAMTTTVTLVQASPIYAIACFDLTATTAACVAQIRTQINGVNGQVIDVSIDNTTDHLTGTCQQVSATLAPGTYTVNAQIARLSGTGTVNFFQGTLFSQGQQGVFTISGTPAKIIYVATNGNTPANGADGSFGNPYLKISDAVTAANAIGNVSIAVAPGTTYSDTAPVTVTASNIFIGSIPALGMAKGDNRTQNDNPVQYAGSIIVNQGSNFVSFGMNGIQINVPSTAAWNANPYALTLSSNHQNRAYISNCVLKSVATTRGAVQINASSIFAFFQTCELFAGTTTGPNTSPLAVTAGTANMNNCKIIDAKSANAGTAISLTSNLAMYGGICTGNIVFNTATSLCDMYQGCIVNSGANAAIALNGSFSSGYFTGWDCVLNCTATNAITGAQIVYAGLIVYGGTTSIAGTVNNGAGMPLAQFLLIDGRAKYYEPNPSNWATSVPGDVVTAINRIASLVKTLNGGTPIP